MKYIEKSKAPDSLSKFKNLKYANFVPRFSNLPENVYRDIVQQLLMDQGALCCYTLDEITSETATLVHLNSGKFYPNLELEYKNMYLALRQPDKLPPDYRIGYSSKGDQSIPDYLSDIRCHTYFRYNTLGEMIPANTHRTVRKCRDNFKRLSPEQQMVFTTIELLNLNADRLKDQRKAIFQEVMNIVRKAGKAQVQALVARMRQRDKKGRYKRFNEVVIYYLENL